MSIDTLVNSMQVEEPIEKTIILKAITKDYRERILYTTPSEVAKYIR